MHAYSYLLYITVLDRLWKNSSAKSDCMFWIQKSEHILILKSARNVFEQRFFKDKAVNLKYIKPCYNYF